MKRILLAIAMSSLIGTHATLAAGAGTSATAGSSRWSVNGTAAATAEYQGNAGWTRTEAQSGRINTATGVAVGVDEDGIALSVSNALATPGGPALAGNFNLSIDRNGGVSGSFGVTSASGPHFREASAGGASATTRHGGTAISEASGRTDDHGVVRTRTGASNVPARRVEPRETFRGIRTPARAERGPIRLASRSRLVR